MTMNYKKTIGKMLFGNAKTELSSKRIELGLVDDMQKYTKGFSKYKNEGDGLVNRSQRLLAELKETQAAIYKWSDVGESITNDIVNVMNKFEKAAKEIGVDPNSVKEYNAINKSFTQYAKLEQDYQKIAKELSR